MEHQCVSVIAQDPELGSALHSSQLGLARRRAVALLRGGGVERFKARAATAKAVQGAVSTAQKLGKYADDVLPG